jgi:hypothetical protein
MFFKLLQGSLYPPPHTHIHKSNQSACKVQGLQTKKKTHTLGGKFWLEFNFSSKNEEKKTITMRRLVCIHVSNLRKKMIMNQCYKI